MARIPKSAQLQVRVTEAQKSAIQRAAARLGMDMSSFVLAQVLSAPAQQFQEHISACTVPEPRFALAELNTFLSDLSAGELRAAVATPPAASLTSFLANTVAAMVELACQRRGIAVPGWTAEIEPLAEPVFGSSLQSVRLHLLRSSPAPFRRRNLFMDASLGDQV